MMTRRRRGSGHAVIWAVGAFALAVLACSDAAGPGEADTENTVKTVQLRAVAAPSSDQGVRLRAVVPEEARQSGVLRALPPTEKLINATYREETD